MTTLTLHQTHRPTLINTVAAKVAGWRESRRIAKLQRQIAAANTGRITVREFLARLGADETTIRSLESRLGKAIAAAYRAETETEPAKSGLALVRGQAYPVFAYGWDRLDLISRTAVAFPAVAALIGA
jgi:hypothetical protein